MRKFINEVKLYIKFKIKQFIETRFFLAILCLIIGATSTICFYEGKPLYNYINQGLIYTVELNRASAEEVPQGGEVVSAGSLQEVSLTIPAKGSIEELIAHFFKTDAQIAIAVAKSESNLNPLAHNENNNGTIDTGVFQINSIHGYSEEYLQDPENNIKVAKELFDRSGWTPWVAYNNGNYKYNL